MINAVGRDIPKEILEITGKEPFQGNNYKNGNTPWFKNGFSYQTGVGGASIASTISLTKIMKERNIKMGFDVGGLTKPMCQLLEDGMVRVLLDTQNFDLDAVQSLRNPNHHRITAGAYANPLNKGAFVNRLDYVVLASLEVDVHFNCNVVVGSDGVITGAQGGHPDTAQGAKCTIVICPLLQGRIPAICSPCMICPVVSFLHRADF